MDEPHTIGQHIRNRRLELHLLQRTLAERLCLHIESLKNWERGVGVPSIRQTPRIIAFLVYDPEPEPEPLPGRLAYARRQLGLTQGDLAKILDADPGTILRWEKGDCVPPAKELQRLRELLPADCGVVVRGCSPAPGCGDGPQTSRKRPAAGRRSLT